MEKIVLSSIIKTKIHAILSQLKFVNDEEANKFRCSKCGDVALYHYFAICKHVFCGKCHGILHNKPCPIQDCTNMSINEISQDMEFEFGINDLQVYCMHKSNGCTDTVELSNILKHKSKCKFSSKTLLPRVWHPPNYNEYYEMCEEKLAKLAKQIVEIQDVLSKSKSMEVTLLSRLDTVESLNRKCEEKLQNANQKILGLSKSLEEKSLKLKEDLLTDAERLTKRFSTEIDDKINKEKSNLEDFVKSTISKDIQKFASNQKEKIDELVNGVKENLMVVLRENADETKIQMEESVRSITADVKNMAINNEVNRKEEPGELMKQVYEKIRCLKDYLLGNQVAEFTWKITGIGQIVKDWVKGVTKEIISKEFHSIVYDNTVQCKLKNNGISSFYIELKIDPNCQKSSRMHLYRITFLIKDQSGTKPTRDITHYDMPEFGKSMAPELMTGFHKAPLSIATRFLEGNSRYVKDDSIVLNVVIEPLDIFYKTVSSVNGTLVWKFYNYSQRKQDWLDDIYPRVPSPCLYTSERGYLVHLDVRIGNQLLAFFTCFNKGENDDNLDLAFSHKTSVTILDQSDEVNKENKTIYVSKKTIDETSYSIGFIPMKNIELSKYLIKDSFVIKFQVESST